VPPVQLSIGEGLVDGMPVVVARVRECDLSAKRCRIASTGKAYFRVHDGDFVLSEVEEQAFLAQREPPPFDRAAVEGTTIDDIDPELVALWMRTVMIATLEGWEGSVTTVSCCRVGAGLRTGRGRRE
jgi:ATP-dependent DNA helicase RecG